MVFFLGSRAWLLVLETMVGYPPFSHPRFWKPCLPNFHVLLAPTTVAQRRKTSRPNPLLKIWSPGAQRKMDRRKTLSTRDVQVPRARSAARVLWWRRRPSPRRLAPRPFRVPSNGSLKSPLPNSDTLFNIAVSPPKPVDCCFWRLSMTGRFFLLWFDGADSRWAFVCKFWVLALLWPWSLDKIFLLAPCVF